MNDNPDVRLVNAHAKGICSHHHPDLVALPRFLTIVFHRIVEACMVEGGADTALVKQVGDLLGTSSASHIDDGRAFYII